MANTTTQPTCDRDPGLRGVPEVCLPTEAELACLDQTDRSLLGKLICEPTEYVWHELFGLPSTEALLFGRRALLRGRTTRFEPDPSVAQLTGESPEATLSTAEEILLFQRLNYSRYQVACLLHGRRNKRLSLRAVRHVLAWAYRVAEARDQIAQANVPLVLAMAKRTRLSGLDFSELVSEGNLALLRSVDKFDCSRGFKFSTYACRSILKSFSRVAMRTSRYRGRFPTEFDPTLEKSDFLDQKRDTLESACVDEIRDILAENRASLNEIEQTVLRERFALDTTTLPVRGKTLEQVGAMIGVTKERVRQIQNKALAKIRSILEENYLAA